jgi:hypothetical protein
VPSFCQLDRMAFSGFIDLTFDKMDFANFQPSKLAQISLSPAYLLYQIFMRGGGKGSIVNISVKSIYH